MFSGSIQHIGWSTCVNNWPKESTCVVYMTTNLLRYVKRAVISIFVFMPSVLDQMNTYCKYIYNDFYMDIRNDLTTLPTVCIWQEKSIALHLCKRYGTYHLFQKMLARKMLAHYVILLEQWGAYIQKIIIGNMLTIFF